MDIAAVQRRTLLVLFVTQVITGVGVAVGASVGALLAAELAGISLSGLAQSALVVAAALFALPATALVYRQGRRSSLAAGYFVAALGAVVIVVAAVRGSVPLLFVGFFLFGGASTASLQARYAAVDLAPTQLRGRHLSLVVWATTLGAVVGPMLAPVAGASLDDYGIPTLAGPFVFSAALFALATLVLLVLLRPDPAVVARSARGAVKPPDAVDPQSAVQSRPSAMSSALRFVRSNPSTRLGVVAMAIGHMVMVGVMAMTPVHIRDAGHDAAHTLSIVGIVLSFHIAGMFAFAPVVGWLTDKLGRRAVIVGGIAVLLAACAVAGTAGHNPTRLASGLMLLGLGWSATMVAGSTLVSESVSLDLRAAAQGLSDLVMGLAGALASAISGVIVDAWGYPTLTLLAAVATVPLIALLSFSTSRVSGRVSPGEVASNQ
jgi:MFS family permease